MRYRSNVTSLVFRPRTLPPTLHGVPPGMEGPLQHVVFASQPWGLHLHRLRHHEEDRSTQGLEFEVSPPWV